MPHDPLDDRLSAYVDGELSPAEREQFEILLREQPELAVAADQIRQMGEGVRSLPRQRLGSDFADRVLAAARAQQAPPAVVAIRRRGWLLAAGALAAAAALVLIALNMRPEPDPIAQPQPLSPAENAVAAVLQTAHDGQAVVVRLRLTKDAIRQRALDQALAAAGIAAAPATASNPAAQESMQGYKSLAAAGPPERSAADVLFIEAEPDRLRQALAAVALSADGSPLIAAGGVIPSTAAGIDRLTKVEGESGTVVEDVKAESKDYAQHLPARGVPLLEPSENVAVAKPAATLPRAKRTRVLVVVEVIP